MRALHHRRADKRASKHCPRERERAFPQKDPPCKDWGLHQGRRYLCDCKRPGKLEDVRIRGGRKGSSGRQGESELLFDAHADSIHNRRLARGSCCPNAQCHFEEKTWEKYKRFTSLFLEGDRR